MNPSPVFTRRLEMLATMTSEESRYTAFADLRREHARIRGIHVAAAPYIDRLLHERRLRELERSVGTRLVLGWLAALHTLVRRWKALDVRHPRLDPFLDDPRLDWLAEQAGRSLVDDPADDAALLGELADDFSLLVWSLQLASAFNEILAPHRETIDAGRIRRWLAGEADELE